MKGRLLTFIELPMFTKKVEELGGIELLVAIENDLLDDPERGAVIQGTNGARKARIAKPGKKGGKSGGLRYIYAYFIAYDRIYLFYLYAKGEQENLSDTQKKTLGQVIKETKDRLKNEAR